MSTILDSPILDTLSTYAVILGLPLFFLILIAWLFRPRAAPRRRHPHPPQARPDAASDHQTV